MDNKIRDAFEKWFATSDTCRGFELEEIAIARPAYQAGAESMQEENKRLNSLCDETAKNLIAECYEKDVEIERLREALNGKEGSDE